MSLGTNGTEQLREAAQREHDRGNRSTSMLLLLAANEIEQLAAKQQHAAVEQGLSIGDDGQSERAAAWDSVCKLLNELSPDWHSHPGTGQESALAAIRALADQRAAVIPECLNRLFTYAHAMTFAHDWNIGTGAGKHRAKLIEAVQDCVAYEQAHGLRVDTPQPVADTGPRNGFDKFNDPDPADLLSELSTKQLYDFAFKVKSAFSHATHAAGFYRVLREALESLPQRNAARVPEDVLLALKRAAHSMAETPTQTGSFVDARTKLVNAIKKYDPAHYGLPAAQHQPPQANQCDGCMARIPVDENGYHHMGKPGGYADLMSCEKDRYAEQHATSCKELSVERLEIVADYYCEGITDNDRYTFTLDGIRKLIDGVRTDTAPTPPQSTDCPDDGCLDAGCPHHYAEHRYAEQPAAPAQQTTRLAHDLYKKGDVDAPDCVLDRNGDIALDLCRRCGKGEVELRLPCIAAATPPPQPGQEA